VILVAGLTPAWQQTLVFDHFRFGEVNRAVEAHWCASGKVFNAGIATHLLGGPSLTLATVGGTVRNEIERDFQSLAASYRWVETAAATRVCTTILDRATGTMTELVENGRPITAEELAAFRQAYAEEVARADVAVVIGSLPAGTSESLYRDLLAVTRCPAVLDFRGEGLLGVLDLKPYVVKPNREELARTVGRPLENDAELLAGMRWLNERGAQWVVITQGTQPIWVSSAERAYRLRPPRADKVVNPIGCGDSLAAGIAWATRAGHEILDAVRLGMAAAAANVQTLLPCRFDPAGIAERAKTIEVEEVID
jgi:1-phosphofructokinase family hexose kinase